jgi:hypothetical protein
LAIGAVLLSSACSPDEQPKMSQQASTAVSAPPAPMPSAPGIGQQRRIAASHSFTLRMSGADIDAVQKQHIETCLKLACTVLSSQIMRNDVNWANGSLSVRVSPDAFEPFTKALAAPPARITSHAETAEDKTVAILDVEARLNAKKALRDQLEILAKQPSKGSLADLLAVQKELANVQGEIEAATAQYAYLTTLTDTIKIDITYVTDPARTEISAFEPIIQAIDRARFTFAHSVGAVITFVVGVVPWLPLLALAIWGIRVLWRRLRRRS